MDYNQDYTDYQLHRSSVRRFIRGSYIRHTASFVHGKAIDFGCGVGDLLKMLPSGSIGLEINKATVDYCRSIGLNVRYYDLAQDAYRFTFLEAGVFSTFIISHVLEHLDNSDQVLRTILSSGVRLGIKRVILVVPGEKGFAYDKTHRTFIDRAYLRSNNLQNLHGYTIALMRNYPFNVAWVGKYFTHNELLVVFDSNKSPSQ